MPSYSIGIAKRVRAQSPLRVIACIPVASTEFHELEKRLAAAPSPPDDETLEVRRARIDVAMGGLPLADGVQDEPARLGGVPSIWLQRREANDAPVLVYLHGGGYRMGSAHGWRSYASQLAVACRARVLLVDYRLAPEHPFPAALDDTLAAYRALLASGVDPGRIVLAGDSAGGGLTASALVALRDAGDALPAGAVCISPWADLTNTAETFDTNAATDRLFSRELAQLAAGLYLDGGDARSPLASPALASFEGLPPLLIHASEAEVLLGDARALAARAGEAGVEVALSLYPEMPHVWHLSVPAFPEAVLAVEEIADFVRTHTGEKKKGS